MKGGGSFALTNRASAAEHFGLEQPALASVLAQSRAEGRRLDAGL